MKKILVLVFAFLSLSVIGQVGIGTKTPSSSSILDLTSTNKGFLPPRMTENERNNISSPVSGLTIYNTSTHSLQIFNGAFWSDIPLISPVITNCSEGASFNGTYNSGVSMNSSNTFTITVTNNSSMPVSINFVATDLVLSGASGLSVSNVSGIPALIGGNATLAPNGESVVLTYTLTGSTSGGNLTATWNKFNLNCIKTIQIPNSCGAFVASGQWKEFKCHNMGATDTTLDPNIPIQAIHGNYYQWGRSTLSADTNTPSGIIAGWNSTPSSNGSWQDGVKTGNDPCPSGFRIPTSTQWSGVINPALNTVSRTGVWTNDSSNFSTAIHFGPSLSVKTLTLPSAGYRQQDSTLRERGATGLYWSSTESGVSANGLYFSDSYAGLLSHLDRILASSLRCIAE